MGVSFNIKVKHYDSSVSVRKFSAERGKKIAQIIGRKLEEDVVKVVAPKVVEKVWEHNERVITQIALFFQRVVSRTPKDERYFNYNNKRVHTPDDDFVWKHWKIRYWGKELSVLDITVTDMYFLESRFSDKNAIEIVKNAIIRKLFRGEENFLKRKAKIRNIRIENDHPRFAMLEYGTYKIPARRISKGLESYHGIQNGYSVQAPYGMLRITQAEIANMSTKEIDSWCNETFEDKKINVSKVPSKAEMKKLVKIMTQNGISKRHLSNKDIDAIMEVYSKV